MVIDVLTSSRRSSCRRRWNSPSSRRLRRVARSNKSSKSHDQTYDPEERFIRPKRAYSYRKSASPLDRLWCLHPQLYINDKQRSVVQWCGVTERAPGLQPGDQGTNPTTAAHVMLRQGEFLHFGPASKLERVARRDFIWREIKYHYSLRDSCRPDYRDLAENLKGNRGSFSKSVFYI